MIIAARRSIAPLLWGTFLQRFNSGANTVVLGLFLAQLFSRGGHSSSISNVEVGLLPVVFYVTELVLAPFLGGLSDRWGRRNFLIIGPLFGVVQTSLLFFTPSVYALLFILALQALAGISGAMTTPAALGYLADYTIERQGQRMRIMSLYELVTSGGIGVGTVVGGLAWSRLGRLVFLVLAVIYLLVVLFMMLSPVVNQLVDRGDRREVLARYRQIFRIPRLLIFIPAWLCICSLVGIWLSSQLTFILSSPVHFPHQRLMGSMRGPDGALHLGIVLGAYVLCFGLGLLFWAFFLNRVPRLYLMFMSIIGLYLVCVALFGINHRSHDNDGVLWFWLPLLAIGIFAETSFAPAALAYLADISESSAKDRGLIMGLYSVFLGLGQILGNGLGGVFSTKYGFDGLIYLTAILTTVALVALLWLFGQEKRHSLAINIGKAS